MALELEEVKSMLRAVLMSSKEGVPAHVLQSKSIHVYVLRWSSIISLRDV